MLGTKNMQTNVNELATVRLVRPAQARSSWKGVKWIDMIHQLHAEMNEWGWKVKKERFALNRSGADIVYAAAVDGPELGTFMRRWWPAIGFMASNARRQQLTFYCGLMDPNRPGGYVDSKFLGGKFSNGFSLTEEISRAVIMWEKRWEGVKQRAVSLHAIKDYENLHNTLVLLDKDVQRILFEAARKFLMPWTRIRKVVETFEHTQRSAWGLIQAFVKVASSNPPMKQLEQVLGFTELLEKDVRTPRGQLPKMSPEFCQR